MSSCWPTYVQNERNAKGNPRTNIRERHNFYRQSANDKLLSLLSASTCLTFVPLFEGFGLPPVEAMQCQIPVMQSI